MKKYILFFWIFCLWLINFSSAEITSVICFDSDVEWYVECPFTVSDYYSLLALSWNDVQWSSLFIDWTQITWSNNVYITLPDYFDYSTNYYTWYMDLNIENVGDPEYMENILAIETYHPTGDEFAVSFVGGLTLIMPYIIITLFIIFVWRIIKRVFK